VKKRKGGGHTHDDGSNGWRASGDKSASCAVCRVPATAQQVRDPDVSFRHDQGARTRLEKYVTLVQGLAMMRSSNAPDVRDRPKTGSPIKLLVASFYASVGPIVGKVGRILDMY